VRDFSFIHGAEDVAHVLSVVAGAGLTIRDGGPTSDPGPIVIEEAQFPYKEGGQFVGYRDEWIFGEPSVYRISAGAYEGQYDMSPGINCVGIELYFMGEREAGAKRRLGNGDVGRRIDWYSPEKHEVYPAPPEVKSVFDTICKRLNTGKRVRAGGRTYHLLGGALQKIQMGYLPPFDFIKWPSELR